MIKTKTFCASPKCHTTVVRWLENKPNFHKVFASILHAVAQLVEALCYKSEGRGFDSRWCHWNFSLT